MSKISYGRAAIPASGTPDDSPLNDRENPRLRPAFQAFARGCVRTMVGLTIPFVLAGCATAFEEAQVELATVTAKTKLLEAAADVAALDGADPETRRLYIVTKAMSGGRQLTTVAAPQSTAQILAGTFAGLLGKAADVGLAVYGIRSNRDVQIAGIGANRDIQLGAQNANRDMFANAGAMNAQIATAGFSAGSLGTAAGYQTLGQIIASLERPISVGAGATFVGRDNTGNAGQGNRLTSPDTTTTNCQSGTGAPSAAPQAGSATTGTAGTITLTMPPATSTTECKP